MMMGIRMRMRMENNNTSTKMPKNIFIHVTNNEFVKTYVRNTIIIIKKITKLKWKKTSAKDDVVLIINLILKHPGVRNKKEIHIQTHK